MLDSSLHGPNDPRWQTEPEYSSGAEHLLNTTDKQLAIARATGDTADREHTLACAWACTELPGSLRQSMRADYLLGCALTETQRYAEALETFDGSLDVAAALRDWGAFIELAHRAGAASGQLFHYREAAEYESLAVQRLALLDIANGGPRDAELEIDVFASYISNQFVLARPMSALSHIEQARTLIPLIPATSNNSRHEITLDWIEAQLHRWHGEPARALPLAERAAKTLATTAESAGEVLSLGRLLSVGAEIALDLAERQPPSASAREPFIRQARRGVRESERIARDAGDEEGVVLAALARARLDRVTNRNVDRAAAIQRMLRRSRDLGDSALVAQSLTSLGHEYAALGERESSLTCYRRAIATVDGTDLPAMGVFARRAVLHDQEWNVGA